MGMRSCPPHPNPLPKERENYRQSLPHRRRFDLGAGSAAPSPWGEGWGEGGRSARIPMAYSLEPSRNLSLRVDLGADKFLDTASRWSYAGFVRDGSDAGEVGKANSEQLRSL